MLCKYAQKESELPPTHQQIFPQGEEESDAVLARQFSTGKNLMSIFRDIVTFPAGAHAKLRLPEVVTA